MKSVYLIQPILLGSKSKSIAIIIPKKVALSLNIDDASILTLKPDEMAHLIILEKLNPDATA